MTKKKHDSFANLKLDSYEQELEDALEAGEFERVKNFEEMKKEAQKIAAYTLKQLRKDKSISLRVNERTLEKFKAKAAREGIPYQTLIASLIHKYANNTL